MSDIRSILERLSDEKRARAAFNELYMMYAPRVNAFALSLIKNEDEADDITHDIFLKLWARRTRLKQVGNFSAYLFIMTKNAVTDKFHTIRSDQKYKEYLNLASDIFSEDLQQKINNDEMLLLLEIAIENFPPRRKEIFLMSRMQCMSYKEIADKLGISTKTVENQMTSALAALRKIAL